MTESIELPSKDLAAFVDKCIKAIVDNSTKLDLEILGLYSMIPPEQLSSFRRQIQTIAYGEKWVADHDKEYDVELFRNGQDLLKSWFKMKGISFERVS